MATTTVKNLTDRAMLASLSISVWRGFKFDRKTTDEVHTSHGAAADAGRYNKHLFAKGTLSTITSAQSQARTYFDGHTLAWDKWGRRLLPATFYYELDAEMRQHRDNFQTAVRDFIAKYPEQVELEKQRINGLYQEGDYPPVEKVRAKFQLSVDYCPLPDADDFRVRMADEDTAAIIATIQAQADEKIEKALRDCWARLYKPVADMVTRLKRFDERDNVKKRAQGERAGTFTKSITENISEILDLLPSLNVFGDREMEQMVERVRAELLRHDRDQLQGSTRVRKAVLRSADQILADMAGFVGDMTGDDD